MAKMRDLSLDVAHSISMSNSNTKNTSIYIANSGEHIENRSSISIQGKKLDRECVLLWSDVLQEKIIVALRVDSDLIDFATERYPGVVLYYPPEIDVLEAQVAQETMDDGSADQFLRDVHRMKKQMNGWIVPPQKRGGRPKVVKGL